MIFLQAILFRLAIVRSESYTHDYRISGVTKTRPVQQKVAARASCVLQPLLRQFVALEVDLNGFLRDVVKKGDS